jgi:8-oxo-dGTP pyrophosphatase MutT (NUDIX family)
MQWKPNVTVAAVIHEQDRFLLVEEEADEHVVYNQPAGHLEQGEHLLQAAQREVLEETARDFRPECLVGVYLYPNRFNPEITYLRFCFAGSCGAPQPGRDLDEGIIRTLWLTRAELDQRQDRLRSPLVLKCIDDYLAGHYHPLDLLNHSLP